MAIRAKLTTRPRGDAPPTGGGARPRDAGSAGSTGRERTEEEKALRRARVAQAKDALARSADLKGAHVPAARKALKLFLQNLDQPRQPSDEAFQALLEAPFTEPPRAGRSRPSGGRRSEGSSAGGRSEDGRARAGRS